MPGGIIAVTVIGRVSNQVKPGELVEAMHCNKRGTPENC